MKFLRRTSNRYSKLGKNRKKKQVWRRPTGRDNKMREKRKGYPSVVSVGQKKDKEKAGKIKKKKPVIVFSVKDLDKVKKSEIVIIGSVGKKKKIELAKKAKELNLFTYNINPKTYLKQNKLKEKKKNKEKPKEKKK